MQQTLLMTWLTFLETGCTPSRATGTANILFPLTCNGVYVSSGRTETVMTSKLPITTDADWLTNVHAGQMLATEFLEPAKLNVVTLAQDIGVVPERIIEVIDGIRAMDAELDLRLARYFRLSEGFFLRLQNQHDLLAAKRALNGSLEQIVPRAA
jgi:antitoxin HigA-1